MCVVRVARRRGGVGRGRGRGRMLRIGFRRGELSGDSLDVMRVVWWPVYGAWHDDGGFDVVSSPCPKDSTVLRCSL